MTIPATPLPRLGELIRGAVAVRSHGEQWGGNGRRVRTFSRGGVALAAAADITRRARKATSLDVWLPDFMCNEALDWLRGTAAVRFYRVGESLEPEWEDLPRENAAVVIVHYFGFPNPALGQLSSLRGLTVIEDAAHVLAPRSPIGGAQLVVYSPRKLLSVPPIGCLVVDADWEAALPETEQSAGGAALWVLRRLAQNALRAGHIPWHWMWPADGSVGVSTRVPLSGSHTGPAPFAERMLTVESRQLEEIEAVRRRNYEQLSHFVGRTSSVTPLFALLPANVCPYAFPLRVSGGAARLIARLRSAGIPASSWPDLAPEVLRDPHKHRVAHQLASELVLLPVHQGLSLAEVNRIGETLIRSR